MMTRYYGLAERPWIEDDSGGYYGLPVGAIGSVDLAPVGGSNWVFVTSDAPFDSAVEWRVGNGDRLEDYDLAGAELDGWNSLLGTSIAPCKLIDALWQTLTTQSDPDGEIRAKPIMPTHRGRLNLYLGGHSLIRGERMPRDPRKTGHWKSIQRVVQNDYRAVYEAAARDAKGEDPILHRKFLGAMARKYKLDADAAVALLTPSRGVPRDRPMKPTTTLSDNFNRGDDATGLGTASGGGTWANAYGTMGISSNQAYNVTSGLSAPRVAARLESDLSSVDHYVEGNSTGSTQTSRFMSICARFASSDNTYYCAVHARNQAAGLRKSVSGTLTTIGTSGVTALDCLMRVTCDGSTISLNQDGVNYRNDTDTSITTGTRIGCGSISDTSNRRIDNLSAADLIAGGAPGLGLIGGGLIGQRIGLVQ